MAAEIPPLASPLPTLRAPRWAQALVAGVFFAVLGVFCVLTVFGPGAHRHVSNAEKRTLAPAPGWPRNLAALRTFPGRCEAWINDHLWLRVWLVGINSFLQVRLFDHSPQAEVIIGKQHWLYYNSGFTIDDYRGQVRFSKAQLDFVRGFLGARSSWFARRHIPYVFVVAPDKHTIYPEYLPDRLRSKFRPGTALDQFLEAARQSDHVAGPLPVLDLRPALLAARPEGQLYMCTDTHWNELGARAGARAIRAWMQQQRPDRHLPPPTGGLPIVVEGEGGDLAAQLGLARVLRERRPHWPMSDAVVQPPWLQPGMEAWWPYANLYVRQDDAADLRAIILHDSYGLAMEASLAEAGQETLFLGRPGEMHFASFELMRRMVDDFRPDVVVEEVVERNLGNFFYGDVSFGPETTHYMQDR